MHFKFIHSWISGLIKDLLLIMVTIPPVLASAKPHKSKSWTAKFKSKYFSGCKRLSSVYFSKGNSLSYNTKNICSFIAKEILGIHLRLCGELSLYLEEAQGDPLSSLISLRDFTKDETALASTLATSLCSRRLFLTKTFGQGDK